MHHRQPLISQNLKIPKNSRRVDVSEFYISTLEHNPGCVLRYEIMMLIKTRSYQPTLSKYLRSRPESHFRSFQPLWFKLFPSWLEYSSNKDAVFCLSCFLFSKSYGHSTQRVFIIDGFKNLKKVRDEKHCVFFNHILKNPNSLHRIAERLCEDLINQSQHIQKMFDNFTSE